jgi:hypothetical protein
MTKSENIFATPSQFDARPVTHNPSSDASDAFRVDDFVTMVVKSPEVDSNLPDSVVTLKQVKTNVFCLIVCIL